jgi:hypothetical protein
MEASPFGDPATYLQVISIDESSFAGSIHTCLWFVFFTVFDWEIFKSISTVLMDEKKKSLRKHNWLTIWLIKILYY